MNQISHSQSGHMSSSHHAGGTCARQDSSSLAPFISQGQGEMYVCGGLWSLFPMNYLRIYLGHFSQLSSLSQGELNVKVTSSIARIWQPSFTGQVLNNPDTLPGSFRLPLLALPFPGTILALGDQ